MEASVAIQVLPEAPNDEELCRIVDEVIDYIAQQGYNYYVGPFETTIEGPYEELMDIVKECQHIAIRAGAPSVASYQSEIISLLCVILSKAKDLGKRLFHHRGHGVSQSFNYLLLSSRGA